MMLVAPPTSLVTLLDPWAGFYSDSKLIQTIVTFAHVAALVVGGGVAIAADRATLRMQSDVDRRRHLLEIAGLHRFVVASLAILVVSGILMFTADVETFWGSWIYWVKMVFVALLLANGARMRSIERRATVEPVVTTAHWNALRGTAWTSIALWMAITFAGVALLSYA